MCRGARVARANGRRVEVLGAAAQRGLHLVRFRRQCRHPARLRVLLVSLVERRSFWSRVHLARAGCLRKPQHNCHRDERRAQCQCHGAQRHPSDPSTAGKEHERYPRDARERPDCRAAEPATGLRPALGRVLATCPPTLRLYPCLLPLR